MPTISRSTRAQGGAACIALVALGAASAYGQGTPEGTWTPPGLPSGVDWTFNFNATFGAFTFGNSLYGDAKPDDITGDLTANWYEGSLKPTFSAQYTLESSAQFYGAASAVGERTYGAAPTLVGGDANSFEAEDFYFGWRSGNTLEKFGENAVDLTIGRSRYQVGNGLLLSDGASEGGTRGGYWTNARQAFELAVIGRFRPGDHTLEGFFLKKDELPESDSDTELSGINYEYALGDDSTFGVTYMNFSADAAVRPERDGLDVLNLRAYTAPFRNKAISFEAEYATEDNGTLVDSTAWNVLGAYQLQSRWMPKVSYRYAIFEGDDPSTPQNESFDPLLTGFSDWGAWWQGEIAGEYFVSNSNLISHQFRVHVTPNDAVSMGLILYDFALDQVATPAGSDSVATELDWYMDWSLNDNFLVSFVAAWADPGAAVTQSSGRTDSFLYGMVFLSYSF